MTSALRFAAFVNINAVSHNAEELRKVPSVQKDRFDRKCKRRKAMPNSSLLNYAKNWNEGLPFVCLGAFKLLINLFMLFIRSWIANEMDLEDKKYRDANGMNSKRNT